MRESFRSCFPVLKWAPEYSVQKLRYDIVASFTVIAMLVPQGNETKKDRRVIVVSFFVLLAMAYALLAGMQPVYGLWTAIVPMVLYCFLGNEKDEDGEPTNKNPATVPYSFFSVGGSRELSVGPSAMLSLTIPAAISHVVEEKFANDQSAYHSVAST